MLCLLRKVSSLCAILNRVLLRKSAKSLPTFNLDRFDGLKLHSEFAKRQDISLIIFFCIPLENLLIEKRQTATLKICLKQIKPFHFEVVFVL